MRGAVSRRRWGVSGWLVSGALAAAVCVGGCQQPSTRGRVMVLGLDGVDPDAVDLLVADGKLPHFVVHRIGLSSIRSATSSR